MSLPCRRGRQSSTRQISDKSLVAPMQARASGQKVEKLPPIEKSRPCRRAGSLLERAFMSLTTVVSSVTLVVIDSLTWALTLRARRQTTSATLL